MFTQLKDNSLLISAIVTIIYLVSIFLLQPDFLKPSNLLIVSYYTSLIIPAVLGSYLLILLGLFDLSLGATAAMAGVVYAALFTSGFSEEVSITFGLGCGIVAGLINAVLVSTFGVPTLITTIITMTGIRGLALLITSGRVIGGLPGYSDSLLLGHFPVRVLLTLIFGFLSVFSMEILSRKHIYLRYFYFAGSNRIAAFNAGINIRRLEYMSFLIAGAGAAVVGILQSARTSSASPLEFPDLALDSIAACIIGGMRLSGGRGTAIGSAVGAMILIASRNIVNLTGVGVYWDDIAISLVLLTAVVASGIYKRGI